MPTAYENLSTYLRPGHPRENKTDSTIGNEFLYRTTTTLINANKPAVGDLWADGYPVLSSNAYELHGTANISELAVITSQNVPYSSGLGTPTLEQTTYGLRWRPIVKPLETHPDFQESGIAYPLDATARKCIIGWRAEQDPALRSEYKFRKLDSNGEPGDEVDIATESPNAKVFIQLLEKGVEEYVDYMPVWRKRSIYKGSVAPDGDSIGQAENPPGPLPSNISSDYFFVKSNDEVERIGTTSRWRRDEEWEGAKQVFADRDDIIPGGEPYV